MDLVYFLEFVDCNTLAMECTKGQLISKGLFGILNSPKKQPKKFDFTSMILVFVRFLGEIEDTKKTFRN